MAAQLVYPRDNDALDINPPGGDAHITVSASDWLWAVFAVMLISWFAALAWVYSKGQRNRILHFIPTIVLSVSTVVYFAMASDLGWTIVRAEFGSQPTRQIWFVRYIQWFINAPLLLLALLSLTNVATPKLLVPLFFSWYLVVNGLVGALVPSSYKWGFFTFGLFGLFFVWWQLLTRVGHRYFINSDFRLGYVVGAGYISFIWMLYPICWGLSEGSNKISPTSEMIFYGILDLLSGPVFLLAWMAHLSRFDTQTLAPTSLGSPERGRYGGAPQQKGPHPAPLEAALPAPQNT